jgi:hypothetical protein
MKQIDNYETMEILGNNLAHIYNDVATMFIKTHWAKDFKKCDYNVLWSYIRNG